LIHFNDVQAVYSETLEEELFVISRVMRKGRYVLGEQVEEFEENFSNFHGIKYGIACSSGTAALHLAIACHDFPKGSKVLVPGVSFFASAAAVRYAGLEPVFVDTDNDGLIDLSVLEKVDLKNIVAIMPVYLHGRKVASERLAEIAKKFNWVIIEDAAQAHGLQSIGATTGLASTASYSFYPGKNLGAAGEGGMVLTNDYDIFKKIKLLRDWGAQEKYHHDLFGFNYRMDAIQGAILNIRLKMLPTWQNRRFEIAKVYDEKLSKVRGLRFSDALTPENSSFHIYSIFHPKRDLLASKLKNLGVETGMHYPVPLHKQIPFKNNLCINECKTAENFSNTQLSLPIYGVMQPGDGEIVAAKLSEVLDEIDINC
jgi:dTDP-4-amino-4,6-dideoxygalactose transaminase